MNQPDAVALSVFASRIAAVCDEMGAVLRRAAFSPNIKDRQDFSCAVFDAEGGLCAQAAHIPVHLGSMAYAMSDIVSSLEWEPGDQIIVNDPYLGGTHLPDVTLIAPVFAADTLVGFVANRAHHADIGSETPGSMPLSGRLEDEGMVIPPTRLVRGGRRDEEALEAIAGRTRNAVGSRGDLAAQLSANDVGSRRLGGLVEAWGVKAYRRDLGALNDYAERLARRAVSDIPDGEYTFTDYLDGDGLGAEDLAIRVRVSVDGDRAHVDFRGTAGQTGGNLNCPLSVAAAGVYYVFRCLMPLQTPACAGMLRPVTLSAPEGSLLNARRPAAVAAGNVETSSRVVDAVCGALAGALPERIPAASQGTMNNLGMGSATPGASWDYYETIAGGMGAGRHGGGHHAVHTHMTNTLNTPVEVLELGFPIRVKRYAVRRGSGGDGARPGGDGVIREFEFLADAQVSLITERRRHAPWGLAGGADGQPGRNAINGEAMPGKFSREVRDGDVLTIETPGGGGYGSKGQG